MEGERYARNACLAQKLQSARAKLEVHARRLTRNVWPTLVIL